MSIATVEHDAKFGADAVAAGAKAAQHAAVNGAESLAKSGSAAIAGFQELAKAYQALATKNAERLTTSIQQLATVKTPTEFLELQRKLITEGVEAAVADSAHIAKLTTAAFTAAFEPLQKQVAAFKPS
jgi:hypothetical protein